MAKKYEVSLESNKKLSQLIDTNLQKESQLLQSLIQDVVDANKKVKTSHEKRVRESKERLEQLNRDIEDLNQEINRKEKDTTMQQLNYLLDSKNKIYQSIQAMRKKNIDLFLSKDVLANTNDISNHLFTQLKNHSTSSDDVLPIMESIREALIDLSSNVVNQFKSLLEHSDDETSPLSKIAASIKEETFEESQLFSDFQKSLHSLEASRNHVLKDIESDLSLDKRIEDTFSKRKEKTEKALVQLQTQFKTSKNALVEEKNALYDKTLNALKEKYKDKLQGEIEHQSNVQDNLKKLRLDIIKAEKDNDLQRAKQLFKQYEKETRKKPTFLEEKLEKKAQAEVQKETKRINQALYTLEKDYLNKRYEHRLELSKIQIERGESKDLFKVREDFKGLKSDLEYNERLKSLLIEYIERFEQSFNEVITFIEQINESYIKKEYQFLKHQKDGLDYLNTLELTFNTSQLSLTKLLRMKQFSNQKLEKTIVNNIKKHSLQIEKHQKLAKIDKQMTDIKNTHHIDQLYAEEDIQSEKIYQNARIELADLEYELQLLKIQSLYDNEKGLTKAQADRLDIGYEVNESMVSTTYESQILFAKQQIEYAESEYNLRLENIELSLNKEKEYALNKLNEHQQKYKSDKIDLINERDKKLEDLSYKQALFTEDKDKKKLNEQEENLRSFYDQKIEKIDEALKQDPYVKRYKKQLDNADNRAEKAKQDALQIKEKSIQTFENMIKSSEEKLNQFKSLKQQDTLKPMIDSEENTAKNRLNESIEDAKALYEEKIKDPKNRLKTLDEKLQSIYDDEDLKHTLKEFTEEKATIETTIQQQQTDLNQALDDSIETINSQEDKFLNTYQNALDKLKDKPKHNIALNDASIKNHLSSIRQSQKNELNNLSDAILTPLETFKAEIPKYIKSLNEAIQPAYKAYNNYLSKLSSSIESKEKQSKKLQNIALKESLKTLKKTYKK